MNSNISFGECLKYLLTTLDISMSRLSKVINVDSSLINRWIHGKRIPPYGTSYIEKIAEFLSKNIYNTYQIEKINELYKKIYGDTRFINNEEEKIRKMLLETQGYSIENKKIEKIAHKNYYANSNHNQVFKLHSKYMKEQGKNEINNNFNQITNSIQLSHDDMIICEIDNIFTAAITLTEEAAKKKSSKGNVIYITFDNKDFNTISYKKLNYWKDTLLKAIGNDWQVIYLMKVDNNANITYIFFNLLLPLIQTKKVTLFSFDKYDTISSQRLVFLASGIGAMSSFPTNSNFITDRCFYFKNHAAIDIFKNYIEVLIETQAHSILNYYSENNNDEYYNLLSQVMEKSGDLLYYNNKLNILLMPEKLYKKLLLRKKLKYNELFLSLLYYRRQLTAFMLNLQNNVLKEIFFTKSMEELIHHHHIYIDKYGGGELVELEPEEIVEFLQNIIDILKTFKNYQVAVIHNINDYFENMKEYNFTIKERQGVFFYIIKQAEYESEMQLSINDPMLVNAFEDYFNDIWSRISPISKDKNDTIAWLQSYIEVLKNEMNCD